MTELKLYLARAENGRPRSEIASRHELFISLARSINAVLVNSNEEPPQRTEDECWNTLERDLELLHTSDLLLADLSRSDYQYIEAVFQIAQAVSREIPVVSIVGDTTFFECPCIQFSSEFICRTPEEAIRYVKAIHTHSGLAMQLDSMKQYYSAVAHCYHDAWTQQASVHDVELLEVERNKLRDKLRVFAHGEVCQLGIGTGDWSETICRTCNRMLGVEQSTAMLNEARCRLEHFQNVRFLQCDVLKDDIGDQAFDCVVVFFLLSLLPRRLQAQLLRKIRGNLRDGGTLLVADSRSMRSTPSVGLGRTRMQQRFADGRRFTLYKDHFPGQTLQTLIERAGFDITQCGTGLTWFSWVAARKC
ncbi:MAG: class I SAM-dependent methyltransferase [Planctomycetes bacterium]|nr:class I SAM-dependent methyltransferase [Planctomycetota bacterium]